MLRKDKIILLNNMKNLLLQEKKKYEEEVELNKYKIKVLVRKRY